MARAMHEPLLFYLFYHSIVFSEYTQLSLYMYANSCSIEAFLLHLAYLSSEFKVGATYISTVQLALFPVLLQDYLLCHLLRYQHSGVLPFCMLFSSNNRTIPAPLPELQIIFFSYVSPLSISFCETLPKQRKSAKWVEIPGSVCWEYLPRQRRLAK